MSNDKLQIANPNQLAAIFGNQQTDVNEMFASGIKTSSFLPTLSIRGKDFRLVIDGEETKLKEREILVHLIASRRNVSKTFYPGQWTPGQEQSAPDCSSSDGVFPDNGVKAPQATSCQVCPNNEWGSKITQAGKKGKACADYKLVIVALASNPEAVFQLRVPAASLKLFGAYVKKLNMNGIPADGAITKIFFADAEFPQLEFDLAGTVKSAEEYATIKEIAEREDVVATLQVKAQTPVQIAPVATPHIAVQPVAVEQPAVIDVHPIEEETTEVSEGSIDDILSKWQKNK